MTPLPLPSMKKLISSLAGLAIGLFITATSLSAQGSLSTQVLQLLSRTNSWIGTNTFLDLRLPITTAPSDTAGRIYTDPQGNLYYNGSIILGAGGINNPHNILSSTHLDTVAGAVTRGAVIVGNSTPAWTKLSLCPAGQFIGSNGIDTVCTVDGSQLTSLGAAQLTGTLAALDANALTNLNASSIASGTVPLGRLSNIANAQIASGAAIAYAKLALGGSILNADIASGAGIAYSKLALTSSIVSGDLAPSTILFDRWAVNSAVNGQVPQYVGASWVAHSLVVGDVAGAGSVSSVALTVPAILAVSGSPITASGTLALSLSNQAANLIFAGPSSGGSVVPTFRSMVNGDLPLSGVGAGTYAKVTINTAGIVTSASTQASLTSDVSGILPYANGGTGVSSAVDDTILIGSGSAWSAQSIPNCTVGALSYNTSTNSLSCNTSTLVSHNILSSTHSDSVAATASRGDMMVANSSALWARQAVGAAGSIWTSNGTDPFWSYSFARGTISSSTPWTFTQTWNAAVTFAAMVVNVTDSSSNAGSLLLDLQKASTSQFSVDKSGNVAFLGTATGNGAGLTRLDNLTTVTSTGTQNDFSITSTSNSTTVYFSNASALTITGVQVASGNYQGKRLRFHNIGSSTVKLNNADGGSTATNRLSTGVNGNPILAPGGICTLTYDATNTWRITDFDQGSWLTAAYAGGDFTASSGTWTVDSGDINSLRYWLRGHTLTINYEIALTSVSGGQSGLRIGNGQYGGFIIANEVQTIVGRVGDNTGLGVYAAGGGLVYAPTASTFIQIYKDGTATAAWTAATNATNVAGQVTFEVQ